RHAPQQAGLESAEEAWEYAVVEGFRIQDLGSRGAEWKMYWRRRLRMRAIVHQIAAAHPMIESYRDLLVWQKGMELATACYRLSGDFPPSELYGLTLQLRKSAVSVPANIAEGRGRRSTREFIRFVDIAYGSLAELQTHILLATRLGHCTEGAAEPLLALSDEVGMMLNGLRRSLRRQLRPHGQSLNPES
ncbi:MAG: four helix bundle protein, partial [Gemmatimonadota bacterium]